MKRFLSKNARLRKRVLASICLLFTCVALCTGTAVVDCVQRNSPPTAPVYPQSTLVSQKSYFAKSRYPIAIHTYTSSGSPSDLIAFYENEAHCQESSDRERMMCNGEATPDGEFSVYIDLAEQEADGETTYVIEFHWHTCAPDWG